MKKFKRFLCTPLLVLFAMSILTLPAAAAVTVYLPSHKPAASMTFTVIAIESLPFTNRFFGPVQVTTDAKGVFAYTAELQNAFRVKNITNAILIFREPSATARSKDLGYCDINVKFVVNDDEVTCGLDHLK